MPMVNQLSEKDLQVKVGQELGWKDLLDQKISSMKSFSCASKTHPSYRRNKVNRNLTEEMIVMMNTDHLV
jgi:hypothetical protein